LEIIWNSGEHNKFGLITIKLEIDYHPKLKDKIRKKKKKERI